MTRNRYTFVNVRDLQESVKKCEIRGKGDKQDRKEGDRKTDPLRLSSQSWVKFLLKRFEGTVNSRRNEHVWFRGTKVISGLFFNNLRTCNK